VRRLGVVCAHVALVLSVDIGCTTHDRRSKAELSRRGDELAAQGHYPDAAAEYEAALEADPHDGRLRKKLADAYTHAGKLREAAIEIVRASDVLPADIDAQVAGATAMVNLGRFVDAAQRMAAVLREQPENPGALIAWANATSRLLNITTAIIALGDVVEDHDRYEAARQQLRPRVSLEDDRAAEAAFRKALQLAPAMSEAKFGLVNFLWATGRLDDAEELLRGLADQNPQYPPVNRALGSFYLSRHRETEGERYLRNAATAGEAGAGARFALADYYMRSKRMADAQAVLGLMTEADDATGEVSMRLAPIEFQTGLAGAAVRRVDALLSRQPHHARAALLRAQFLLAMGNPDPRFARAAVVEDPTSTDARLALGQVLVASGDPETALDEYREAVRQNPSATRLWVELVRLSLALERDDEAGQFARKAVVQLPDDRVARVLFVKALIRARDYSTAEQELQPLLSTVPDSPDVLTQLGALHAARGNIAAARAAFIRALHVDRDSEEVLAGLVSLELKARNVAAASELVDPAVAAHPTSPAYLVLAAQVYAAENDTRRSESTLRQALEIDRANVQASMSLADLLDRQSRHEEASKVLERLIDRWPGLTKAQMALAMLEERLGRTAAAQARYKKIVAGNPATFTAAYRLARLYADQRENLDLALSLATGAVQRLPDDPDASDALGWVYTQKDVVDLALPHLQKAVRAVPNNALYRYHLGSAYLSAGNLRHARDEFTRVVQLDPNFLYAEKVRQALAGILQ
jgi:tetratricopeptide (TPR) repeat protein